MKLTEDTIGRPQNGLTDGSRLAPVDFVFNSITLQDSTDLYIRKETFGHPEYRERKRLESVAD